MIRLQRGAASTEIAPELGGAVMRLQIASHDILRPAPAGATDVLQSGCFALAPYCNRIRDGRFAFQGEAVRLAPNMGDHPHPLHGDGWRSAWAVDTLGEAAASLTVDHAPGEWPWAWRARQAFTLRDDGLRIDLELTNTDRRSMPAGLGLHPYFPAPPGTSLRAEVDGVWMSDGEALPTTHHRGSWGPDWRQGAPTAADRLIDHCYTGWAGRAELSGPDGVTTLITASPACRWAHVYSPPGAGFVCVEPVTHMPDPFNHPDSGLAILAPGESLSMWMDITVRS
ncbi:MAG TPA: aldose 1-epimerase [Caulobacteraceae bacterium]